MKVNLAFSISDFNYLSPIQVNHTKLATNKVLKIQMNNSSLDIIEFSPLVTFHNYNVYQWKKMLETFFQTQEIDFENILLDTPYFNMVSNPPTHSGEFLFAIEVVLFHLINKQRPDLLGDRPTKIKINSLFSKDSPDKTDFSKTDCLKLKIRPGNKQIHETLTLIKQALEINPSIKFRLDGNRSFNLEELIEFENALSTVLTSIEYLEEPLKNHNDYWIFKKVSKIPYALDESVIAYQHNLEAVAQECILILKPSLLSLSKCFEFMNKLKNTMVISSSYEAPSLLLAFNYLASLAPETFHGLDTQKFLPHSLSNSNLI